MQNITGLGPESPWTSNLLSATGITHFSNEELKDTFDKMCGESQELPKEQVPLFFKKAYGFVPMPDEMGLYVTALDLDNSGGLSWTELEAGLNHVRGVMEEIAKNAKEHTSHSDFKDDMRKHRRFGKAPMDKYKAPMTEAQSVGWHEEEVENERYPKKACAETKYCNAMLMTNKHFDPF